MKIGYMLASEQFGPTELIDQAKRAAEAGFEALWISDHFHPWIEAQGQSPFVWSVIGGLTQAVPDMAITTSVTCPIIRIHPVILAQATATAAVMNGGKFRFGVGAGENLNEHVTGHPWPVVEERHAMLTEALELIRALWSGDTIDFRGDFYETTNARIHTLPDSPPPIYISAFGPQALEVAIASGDGLVTMKPDIAKQYRDREPDKPIQAGLKVCYDTDEQRALEMAHRIWPNEVLPGQLAQELPTTAHIEQATSLVTPEMVAKEMPHGPDAGSSIEKLESMRDAGFTEVYVQQIGPDMDGFINMWRDEVLPRFV